MTEELFDGQIAASLQRLEMLWQRMNVLPKQPRQNGQQVEEISNQDEELLLQESLEELTCSLHELQVASEEVRQQNEELVVTRLAVEAERQRYQELFEFAPDAYLVTNPDGLIVEANYMAGNLLNVNCDRLIGKLLVVFVPESARRNFRTQLFRVQNGQECRDWEVQIQPRKGELFPAACTVVPVLNSSKQVVNLRWQLRDITKHKQAEQVEQKLKMLDAILYAAPVHLYLIDESGKCLYVSPDAAHTLGKAQTDILGKTWGEMGFPPHIGEPFDAELQKVLTAGQPITSELIVPVADGVRDYEYTISPIGDTGSFSNAAIVTFRDISKHKQAETEINKALAKQKELNDMKASFVSAISQEFRTPLTNIIASAQLIKTYADRWTNEKKNQHLERVQSAVKQTNQLLNDILLVSGAEGDKLQFKPALLDLEKFCRELAEQMQSAAGKQNTIIFSVQGKATSACLDEKLLSSILTNLLSNAIKYSLQGGNIQFNLIGEHSEAIFRVKDEGIGIPVEDRLKLFDSFQRGSNVGHIDGIGLGLSVVKQCVNFHGGKIAVESEVGVGTTVTVTLPLYYRLKQNEQKSGD